jgi:hypothetical protein
MTEQTYEYNGCKIENVATTSKDVTFTFSYGDKRFTVKGPLSIVRTKGSWKYGDETHLTIHTLEQPVLQDRAANNGYTRLEVAMPTEEFERLLQNYRKTLDRNIAKFLG